MTDDSYLYSTYYGRAITPSAPPMSPYSTSSSAVDIMPSAPPLDLDNPYSNLNYSTPDQYDNDTYYGYSANESKVAPPETNDINLLDVLNYIYTDKPQSKKMIYISIGSAQYRVRTINKQHIIDEYTDQQYPLFLRNIKKQYPKHQIYIILIDPCLETPCFTIRQKRVDYEHISYLDFDWEKDSKYNNIYVNNKNNITLFEFRNYVHYYLDEYAPPKGSIYIEPMFEKLNNIAQVEKWFVAVIDYTGRNINNLALQYDKLLKDDRDHIFYGFPTRFDNGCDCNMTEYHTQFVTTNGKEYINIFTPYTLSPSEINIVYTNLLKTKHERLIHDIENTEGSMTENIIIKQIEFYFTLLVENNKSLISIFRRLLLKRLDSTITISMSDIKKIELLYIPDFNTKIKISKIEYEKCLKLLIQYICDEFATILTICHYVTQEDKDRLYIDFCTIIENYNSYTDYYQLNHDLMKVINFIQHI
jgi:hypothetical protein